MRNILVGAIALGSMICTSCSEEGGGNQRKDIPVSRTEAEIVALNNEFSQKVVSALRSGAEGLNGNFVMSPLSLSMDMSMLAAGTGGESQAEILRAMGYEAENAAEVNALNRKLMSELPKADRKTTVSLANCMWYSQAHGSTVKDSYKEVLSTYYSAPLTGVADLGGEEGRTAINKWAKQSTSGMIPEFLSVPLGANTVMALTNATYFKGEWAKKFDKQNTTKEVFHNEDGTFARVNMMKNSDLNIQAYYDGEAGYSLALLDYGNKAYCMAIILPDKGKSAAEIYSSMNMSDLQEYMMTPSLLKTHLNFAMPRFELESFIGFIPALKALGVHSIFTEGGDYSGMFAHDISGFYIDRILQGTKLVVNEEGTEAASSTVISNGLTSPGPVQTKNFIVDRPFAFAIGERSTGAILFNGVIEQL
ncbi:MAG: serpin family protein [Muribaculaceae bacterium]|nr:serpin family protein [Muribaculaceae bacterium]